MLIKSTTFHGVTPQKAIKLKASSEPIIPNDLTL